MRRDLGFRDLGTRSQMPGNAPYVEIWDFATWRHVPKGQENPICRNLGFRDLGTRPQRPIKPHVSKSGISRLGVTSPMTKKQKHPICRNLGFRDLGTRPQRPRKTPCVEIWDFATLGHVPKCPEDPKFWGRWGHYRKNQKKFRKNSVEWRIENIQKSILLQKNSKKIQEKFKKNSKKIQEKFGRVAN